MAEEKEFVFEDWLAEGLKGLRSSHKGGKILPKEFSEHMRAAHREMLLATRSLLDAAIERTEEKPPKKATKIRVEQG
jgi:hypothetical protein